MFRSSLCLKRVRLVWLPNCSVRLWWGAWGSQNVTWIWVSFLVGFFASTLLLIWLMIVVIDWIIFLRAKVAARVFRGLGDRCQTLNVWINNLVTSLLIFNRIKLQLNIHYLHGFRVKLQALIEGIELLCD